MAAECFVCAFEVNIYIDQRNLCLLLAELWGDLADMSGQKFEYFDVHAWHDQ